MASNLSIGGACQPFISIWRGNSPYAQPLTLISMCRATDKRKKRGPETEPLVAVSLLESEQGDSAQVLGSTPNADAWRSGRMLRVGEQVFQVVVNPPSVLKARAEQRSMSAQSDCMLASPRQLMSCFVQCTESACQLLKHQTCNTVAHISDLRVVQVGWQLDETHRLVSQAEVHGLPMVGYPLCPYVAVNSPTVWLICPLLLLWVIWFA